jgi:hypothetical protein
VLQRRQAVRAAAQPYHRGGGIPNVSTGNGSMATSPIMPFDRPSVCVLSCACGPVVSMQPGAWPRVVGMPHNKHTAQVGLSSVYTCMCILTILFECLFIQLF